MHFQTTAFGSSPVENGVFNWILQTTWQAAVLAGLILLVQVVFRKQLSAQWRSGLWLLLVVRLIMPASPATGFSIFNWARVEAPARLAMPRIEAPLTSTPPAALRYPAELNAILPAAPQSAAVEQMVRESSVSRSPGESGGVGAPLPTEFNWKRSAFLGWLIGVCLFGLRLIWTNFRFNSRVRGYRPVQDEAAVAVFNESRAVLGIKQKVTLIETDEVDTPAVYGLLQKRLLLPDGIFERFSTGEVRLILLHELAHLKRRDLEVNWLVSCLQTLHWFNPVLWFAFIRMRADRELATDALVLSHAGERDRVAYGETILKVLEDLTSRPALPGLVGIVEDKERIKERLVAIARPGSTKPWRWVAAAIGAVIGVLALTDAREAGKPGKADSLTAPPAAKGPKQTESNKRRFEMRLLDFDSSAPLSGINIQVEFEPYSGSRKTAKMVTGSDGMASIGFPEGDLKRLAYKTEKGAYLSLSGEWKQNQVALYKAPLEVKLSKGVEIGGKVVDEAGKAIPGAQIFFNTPMNLLLAIRLNRSVTWKVKAGDLLATTDSEGNWKARCIWPTIKWAALRVHHPDYADSTVSTDISKAMEAEGKGKSLDFEDLATFRATFELSPGVSLTGKVIDESENPIPGIPVRYADERSTDPLWDDVMEKVMIKSDTQGKFKIPHLPQKKIYFTVQKQGLAPMVAELDLAKETPQIELTVGKGRKLSGHILDDQGRPLSGVRLSFQDWSIWHGVRWETETNEKGEFVWYDAPAEKFQLAITKDGYLNQRSVLSGGEEKNIRLKPTLKLSGKVVSAVTRQPVEQFTIIWADREESLIFRRAMALSGSKGAYQMDLGQINEELWSEGYAHRFIFRMEAPGYMPFISRTFASENGDVGNLTYDIELTPVPSLTGLVQDAEGHPVSGAQLALKTPAARLYLAGEPQFENIDSVVYTTSDQEGHFQLWSDPQATRVIAIHQKGFASRSMGQFAKNPLLILEPWSRIDGTVWEYDRPLPKQEIHTSPMLQTSGVVAAFKTTNDENGRFSFNYVPPGKYSLYRMIPTATGSAGSAIETIEIKPGAKAIVKMGGDGRPVVGRFKIKNPYVEIDWSRSTPMLRTAVPKPPQPFATAEENQQWMSQPDVRAAFDQARSYPIICNKDGSFRVDEVSPGKYSCFVEVYDPRVPDAMAYSKYIIQEETELIVPETPDKNSKIPFDAGVLAVSLKTPWEAGKTVAPDFEAVDLAGQKLKLSDFRGKYVVLDFWATWCGPCVGEIPYLRKVSEKLKTRSDIVMISLSLDKKIDDLRQFVKKSDMPWLQGYLGDWSTTKIPEQYGVQGIPAIFLVNPEGKIVAGDLSGETLGAKLDEISLR